MRHIAPLYFAIAASTAQADVAEYIHYEFGIRVLSNGVATNGVGGDLEGLSVGTEGVFSLDVNPDGSIYQSDDPDYFQAYQVLDLRIQIGAITSGANPGAYPSGASWLTGLWVENDKVVGGSELSDSIAMIPGFANPELGFSAFGIFQRVPIGQDADMLSSLALPLTVDAALITSPIDMTITSPRDGASKVAFDVFSVEVTYIPSPVAGNLLVLAGLAATRRRR